MDGVTVAGLLGALLLWGAPVDAVSPPPSRSTGTFWIAEERPVRLRLLFPAALQTGQGIFLIASVTLEQSCEYPGPLLAARGVPAGAPEQFRARIWRQLGASCEPAHSVVEQPLHIPTRSSGTLRFDSGDGHVIAVKVSGKPRDGALHHDAGSRPCRFDDDCWPTDVCVPRKGDPTGPGVCGEICGDRLDCWSGNCDMKRGIVGICKDPIAACDQHHSCSWGQVCKRRGGVSWCQWPTELSGASRHDCRSDRECDPGLKCFKQAADTASGGRCQMLCSSGVMACTNGHECAGEGICEWLGE